MLTELATASDKQLVVFTQTKAGELFHKYFKNPNSKFAALFNRNASCAVKKMFHSEIPPRIRLGT